MDHLRRSPTQSNKRDANSSHRNMRHMLERLESTVSALPPTLSEYLDAFNSFCVSGVKLASLLETLFQESPILVVALRFREACELLSDKCNKTGVMLKQDIVGPVKKLAPSLSRLRSRVDTHAKAASKHESYLKQLESLKLSVSPNRQKLDQVEQKFHASAEDFAKEDSKLAEALNELHKMRVEVMGSSFLGILEGQAKLLSAAADIMAPLGAYKEVGKGLSDSPSSLMVKEATVGWLAAAQVNQNLRSFGSMSRNDVQCMMYNHPDGLPTTIRNGLNQKVDQLLKTYARELQKALNPHHKVTGGFHLNPKGIELALRDCCSELEAMGAGAAHAVKREEQEEQITRDVSRTSYKIGETTFGCAMGEHVDGNIREKMRAISDMISDLPMTSQLGISKDTIEEFAFHVLNESCTTVTNTAAKTAVQLVFGKANLVLVRPSPSSGDPQPIEIIPRAADSSIQVTVRSSWWLVEDYAAFTMLHRSIDPDSHLGIVDATYFASLTLQGFTKKEAPPELPTIVVTYRQPSSSYSPNLSARHKNKEKDKEWLRPLNRTSLKLRTFIHRGQSPKQLARSPRNPSFHSFIDVSVSEEGREERKAGEAEEHEGGEEEEPQEKDRSRPPSRRVSSDAESVGGGVVMSSHGSGSSLRSYGRSDSFGRNMKPGYHVYSSSLKRSGSSDTFSSQSTLVPKHSLYEADDSITDLLRLDYGQKGLTPAKILAHTKSEARKHQMYSNDRREMFEYEGKREFVEKDTNSSSDGHSPSDDSGSQEDSRPLSREQVSIASDGDLQNVIAFLSGSQLSTPDEFEYERGEEEFAYSDRGGYNLREYRAGYSDWPREKGAEHGNPPQNDNSSSGSGSSGIDDPYHRGGEGGYAHEGARSRSTSASSFHNEQDGPSREVSYGVAAGVDVPGETLEQSRASLKPHLGSMDSGIHLHSHTGGMKVGEMPADGRTDREREREREREPLKENRKSQELDPFDFSRELGLLIPTQPHVDVEHFGMDILHDSAEYQLGLELYKTMDSDSENSGRVSIPLVSPSSSGSQSPSFLRTRSEENLRNIERSSSRASTHSVPYSLDEIVSDFNHAPGSRPRHARPYSDHYEDRLSQDSLEGIRGPLSQGPHDPPWDWALDRPMRRGWDQPYDAPPRGPGGGPYQYDPPLHPERSRSLQQTPRGRSHDDYSPYSPSPGPPECRHPSMPPPPPQGPGPGPYWHGRYDPGYEPQRMRPSSVGPPCPPPHGGPPPHGPMPPHGAMPPNMGGHPMHDNRFRPVPFGPNPSDAPSPASIHSMSPAPSPRPTPPPTPPPPNHPNLMGPSGPHPLPPHGPPPPHMHNPGPPPLPGPLMGPHQPMPGPRMHMPRPPPPWEARDFPPPMGHPPRGPHTPMGMGHAPSPIGPMPGPPVSIHGGRFLPMGPGHPPPEWERNWKHR